ncbi:hypothetical protein [Flavobacterium sp.]|uniref:hypothetical protein n=1 Tax=Flavobacterium sp. TaxID=239 RepID=UPI002FD926D0
MKNTINLICLLIFINSFSQEQKKNIYIFINQKPTLQIKNDTLNIQQFEINFDVKSSINPIHLTIDKSGNLIKNLTIKSSSNEIVKFKYENIKSNNIPLLINKKNIFNFLIYDEIVSQIKFKNFMNILNTFNVYIINAEYNSEEYFMAKKVNIEKYIGL